MNKRSITKGFTLVELLAIIVVLAIIAVITVPVTTNIVANSKKKAFESSVQIVASYYDEYSLYHDLYEMKTKGVTVDELRPYADNNFISGRFIERNGALEADYVTDGNFCAKGPIDNLRISKSCADLDDTGAEYDESKIHITSTSNTVTVTIDEGFANDPESGIKEYRVVIGDKSVTKQSVGSFVIEGLRNQTEYLVEIKIVNGNNEIVTVKKTIKTTEIEEPTYAISPSSGWAQSKTVTVTYPPGYTNEYSLDGGETWESYTEPVRFTSSGTLIARVSDGTNYVSGSTQTIGQIDTGAPSTASLVYETTSKSITVTASGTSEGAPIAYYQFSKDGGTNWTEVKSSNTHTFSNLTTGTYEVKVRVINATYGNEGLKNNYKESATVNVGTTEIVEPTYTLAPSSGWAQSKTVTINYHDNNNVYTHKYSVDGGNTWVSYTEALTYNENKTIIARVDDGLNYVTASSQTIGQIDTSAPTSASFTYETTSKSITVVASGTDSQSGIAKYQFSKDDGEHWTSAQTSNEYTFNNLTTGTYEVKVKVINGTHDNNGINSNNSLESSKQNVTTDLIDEPTYSISPSSGWSRRKVVTVDYKNSSYTHEYSLDGGISWNTYPSGGVEFTANGTIIARNTDGVNYMSGSSQTVSSIDTSAPTSASLVHTETTKSITVTASGADGESDIYGYQFAITGKDSSEYGSWSAIQSSANKTYNNLQTGTYKVKIRVINNTYENDGLVTTSGSENYKDSLESSITLSAVCSGNVPQYGITPSGWAHSKTVTISRPSGCTEGTLQYSTNGGSTFTNYSSPLTFKSSANIIARVTDGTNYVDASSLAIAQIDASAPTDVSFAYLTTTKSITVIATASDDESGIYGYQFSKDGGANWSAIQVAGNSGNCTASACEYVFDNLAYGENGQYEVVVRAINGTYPNVGELALPIKVCHNEESCNCCPNSCTTTQVCEFTSYANYAESDTTTVTLTQLCTPTYTIWKQNADAELTGNGWAQSKRVKIDVPSGCSGTMQYSTDGGNTFNNYSSPVVVETNGGTVVGRLTDGVNYKSGSTQTVTHIDRTTPTAASVSKTSSTSKSITVTASGTDAESGICGYRFKIDGGSYSSIQSSNSYTFNSLTNQAHNVMVEVINCTYENDGRVTSPSALINYKESDLTSLSPEIIEEPTYTVSPSSGWTRIKNVTIDYHDPNDLYTHQYSIDGGSNWLTYTDAGVTFTEGGTITARIDDGLNYISGSNQTVTHIDRTAPTNVSFTETHTTRSITVTASGTDAQSGIYGYQFSSDGGSTWSPIQVAQSSGDCTENSCKYTFHNLVYGETGQYTIKVKAINGTYPNNLSTDSMAATESNPSIVGITEVCTPTYSISPSGWAHSKEVTISKGSGCDGTLQYSLDGGYNFVDYSTPVTFTANGTIIARLTDGLNYKDGSTQTVTQIYIARAVNLSYDNSLTGLDCSDAQCAIDAIYDIIN